MAHRAPSAGAGHGDPDVDAAAARLRAVRARAEGAEQRLSRLVAEVAGARRRIGELKEHLREVTYRADRVTWQLESVRAGRWWRLGQALAAARGRPAGLPGGVVRALRDQPRPAPPVRPAAGRAADGSEPGYTAPVLDITPAPLAEGPVNLPDLTVAVVHDAVTTLGLRDEWRQIDGFGPGEWRAVLERERPRLLVAGPAAGWPAEALEPLTAWCGERRIPTVYWILDDALPAGADGGADGGAGAAHHAAARLFDRVYVADAAAVPRYRAALGHDRVDVLTAAAQPRLHNPVGVPDRATFDIAGPPGALVDAVCELGPHVYGPAGATPPRPGCHLIGDLPYESMIAARKLYKIVAAGGTRDVFELAAAAIPAVSPRCDLVPAVFGDLVPAPVSHREAAEIIRLLLASAELRDRNAHLAWRTVFAGHTYRHRVGTMLRDLGIKAPAGDPAVSVVLSTCRAENIDHAIAQVARQTWRPLQLVMVLHGLDVEPTAVERRAKAAGIDDVVVLSAGRARSLGACLNLGIDAADGTYIGKMDDDELYGPYYLADLVEAFRYTDADIVGKLAHYVHLTGSGANVLRYPEFEHSYVDLVRGGALLAGSDVLRGYRFDDVTRGEDTRLFRRCRADGVKIYSTDRFSFVMVRHADPARHTWRVSDRGLMADGRIAFYGPPEEHVLV